MLVLASASPRRRELLTNAGIAFTVRSAEIDESVRLNEDPQQYVRRLAAAKAMAAVCGPAECILAADTTVVVDSEILGKPENAADATRMLALLSGRPHDVITGICFRRAGEIYIDAAVTRVFFSPLTSSQIEEYVASGEPLDKAGAYGIQGLASRFIPRIEGCYFNVVGLPVSLVASYLAKLGIG